MGKSIREVMAFDSEEVTYWAAWEEVQGPIGPERLDYLAGTIASTTANLWRKKGEQLGRMDLIDDWGGLRAEAQEKADEGKRRDDHKRMEEWGRLHGLEEGG